MHTSVVHSYIGYNFWSKAVLSAKLKKFGVTFIFVWNRYNYTFFFYVHSKLVSWSFPSTLATCSIFSRCWLRNRKRNHTWINICVGSFQGLWWWRTWTKMIRASCNHDHTDLRPGSATNISWAEPGNTLNKVHEKFGVWNN